MQKHLVRYFAMRVAYAWMGAAFNLRQTFLVLDKTRWRWRKGNVPGRLPTAEDAVALLGRGLYGRQDVGGKVTDLPAACSSVPDEDL